MSRILIIDDDKGIRAAVARLLKSGGYEVDEAADGAEGMKALREKSADLVLLDIFMPVQDGLETLAQIGKEFPKVLVIAMSGSFYREPVMREAKRLGAVQIIEKPFDSMQLLALVRSLV